MIAGVQLESECERLADSENGPHLQANEEREEKIDNTSDSAHFASKCCFMRNFQ